MCGHAPKGSVLLLFAPPFRKILFVRKMCHSWHCVLSHSVVTIFSTDYVLLRRFARGLGSEPLDQPALPLFNIFCHFFFFFVFL